MKAVQCIKCEFETRNSTHTDSIKQPPFFIKQAHKPLPAKQKDSLGPWLAFHLDCQQTPFMSGIDLLYVSSFWLFTDCVRSQARQTLGAVCWVHLLPLHNLWAGGVDHHSSLPGAGTRGSRERSCKLDGALLLSSRQSPRVSMGI